MAKKVLGQAAPAATTDTDLYTVPVGKSSVVSTLSICNRSGVTISYRVAIRPSGAAIENKNYLIYDAGLTALSSDFITIGMTLAEDDVVTVYASTSDASFILFGDEA